MNIKKCDKGHFYNGDRYKICPHCEEMQQENIYKPQSMNVQFEPDRPLRGYQLNADMAETVAYKPIANMGDTVAYSPNLSPELTFPTEISHGADSNLSVPKQPENALPVGWLVAVSGLAYGKQYPIFTCDNFIGSSVNNSICVKGDAYVLPEHHCTLSFDIQTQKVVLNMECSTGEVYVNNAQANESRYLSHTDRIQIGGSVYMLVELCRDGFSWWKPMEQKPIEQKPEERAKIDDIETAFAEESELAARPDISGIRAKMHQKRANSRSIAFSVQETPIYTEISAKDAAIDTSEETNVLTTSYEDAEETNILVASTWRCSMCNGLNSEFAKVCKVCGAKK